MAIPTGVSLPTPDPTVDEIVAAMQRAPDAPEPGGLAGADGVISRGSAEAPIPIIAGSLTSAGYTIVYDRERCEASLVNKNMLPDALKKRNPDGHLTFTQEKPAKPPKRGTLRCWLHADEPNREAYDDLGLPTCRKANLVSKFQVRRHVKARHPTAYETIEQMKAEREKEEDRALQRQVIATMGAAIGRDGATRPGPGRPRKVDEQEGAA